MDEHTLQQHEKKQNAKSKSWSLFHRRKDFIITGVRELCTLAVQIWPDENINGRNKKLIEFIQAKTHFPLINEKLTTADIFKFKPGEISTIIPDTFIAGTTRRKGEKQEPPISSFKAML